MALDLAQRRLDPEWMDDPALDAARHRAALRGLRRINMFSRSAASLWPTVRDTAARAGRPIRLLDVACGSGDVTLALRRRALHAKLPVEVRGCDVSNTALSCAEQSAERRGLHATFTRCDVLREPLPGEYDLITCSLFLHHLTEADVVSLLSRMAASAPVLAVNDLERSKPGLRAAQLGTRLLSRSPVVHVDGPMSVRAAFTVEELHRLAQQAGLGGAAIRRCFPMRMLMVWRRS